jgi:hypothetical protein
MSRRSWVPPKPRREKPPRPVKRALYPGEQEIVNRMTNRQIRSWVERGRPILVQRTGPW